MLKARALFTSSILLLSGSSLVFGGGDSLLQSVQQRWPAKRDGVLVCNLKANADLVESLAQAAGKAGMSLRVIDVENAKDVDAAMGVVMTSRPGFVVLLEQDPILGSAGKQTRLFISRAAMAGVPTVSTGKELLKIGAVLSLDTDSKG